MPDQCDIMVLNVHLRSCRGLLPEIYCGRHVMGQHVSFHIEDLGSLHQRRDDIREQMRLLKLLGCSQSRYQRAEGNIERQ